MKKLVMAGFSLLAVFLLVLGSQTNVVGYQTAQTSQQNALSERLDQKDLLFQTILDLTNNKDIQRIILSSQTNTGGFFNPIVKFSIITPPTLTKNQLNTMYLVGVILSKTMSKSRIHAMVNQYQVITQGMQSEISTIIEKDTRLKGEVAQLSVHSCNCGIESKIWYFLIICYIIIILLFIVIILTVLHGGPYGEPVFPILMDVIFFLGNVFHCV